MCVLKISVELQSVGSSLSGEAFSKVVLEDLHSFVKSSSLGLADRDEASSEQVTLGCWVPSEGGTFGRCFHDGDDEKGVIER